MKQKKASSLLTAIQLKQLLNSARSHYRFILEQEGYNDAKIRALERKCARPNFDSAFYRAPRTKEQNTPTFKQRITIEHLIHSIAVFGRAVESRRTYECFKALYEVANAQAGLFRFNSELWALRLKAGKAAKIKHGAADAWFAEGRAFFTRYRSDRGRPPTRQETYLHLKIGKEKVGEKAFSYPWVCKNWHKIST